MHGPKSKRRLVLNPACVPLASCKTLDEITLLPGNLSALIYKMGMIMPAAQGRGIRSTQSKDVPITTMTAIC